jgi:hypothetical protein
MSEKERDVEAMCVEHIGGFKRKADHNKKEALCTFVLVIVATLVAPMFITLGEGFWLGKVVPSILSLLAAFATAWLQLRKPQQLWLLYRSCQRQLEDQLTRYQFGIDGYNSSKSPQRRLAKAIADVAMHAHVKWEGLVPNPEHVRLTELRADRMLTPGEFSRKSAVKGSEDDAAD